jgi:PBSX family phage terminase large subunit
MGKFINKNLSGIINAYRGNKRGVLLEGSSRSGKTWSWIDFLIWLAGFEDEKRTINVIRQTQASFKTTLYDDFGKRMPMFGLGNPFDGRKEVNTFWILGNKINFLGADNPSKFEGATCDIAIFNEILDIDQVIFDQQEQRCQRFWIADWNPKMTDHWVFRSLMRRKDVDYIHSTFRDNLPFISAAELSKILSYEPTEENISNGTADDYRWNVYGLGKRSVPEGLVFPNVEWIDSFPENVDKLMFGMDFGFTNSPTALVKGAAVGKDLYLEKLIYTPTENADFLGQLLEKTLGKDNHCWADSAEGGTGGMIGDLRKMGFLVFGAKKWPGSIQYGIDLIKRFRLHIVRDDDFISEQENYRYRMINGIKLNVPVDDHNHLWDAVRYMLQHEMR